MDCPSFSPATIYQTLGNSANDVVLADFNGDGFIDMAVTNNDIMGTVSVFLNNGSGVFTITPESPYAVGTSPNGIAGADLTGDGSIDLIVANTDSADVSILFNNGDGVFSNAPGSPISLGVFPFASPFAIAAADFDGDGSIDLAITNTFFTTVNILLNDGSGMFTNAPGSPITGFFRPEEIVAADFDQNGTIDLAVANLFSGDVSVLFGNGDGTFQPIVNYPVGGGLNGLGDFNMDGFPDLVVTDFFSDSISILLNDGLGGFVLTSQSPLVVGDPGSGPVDVTTADFNCDGFPDLAVNLFNSNQTVILLGDGTGFFTISTTLSVQTPSGIKAADLDGNGLSDLAIPNFITPGTVSIFLNMCLPIISGTGNIIVAAKQGERSAVVSYKITAESDCGIRSISCNGVEEVFSPPQKKVVITETMRFPIGVTTVTCIAKDIFGNLSLPHIFTVTVLATPIPEPIEAIQTTKVIDWVISTHRVTIKIPLIGGDDLS